MSSAIAGFYGCGIGGYYGNYNSSRDAYIYDMFTSFLNFLLPSAEAAGNNTGGIDVSYSDLSNAYSIFRTRGRKFSPSWVEQQILGGRGCATYLSDALNEAGSDIIKNAKLSPDRFATDAQGKQIHL